MTKRTLGCLLVLIAVPLLVVALFVGSIAWQIFLHNTIRERVTFVVPTTSVELKHSRIGIHPMMAEYERDIAFIVDGKCSEPFPLMIDTCGGYPINCYLIDAPNGKLLRLDDAVSEHLLDLGQQKVYAITRAMGDSYYGEFDASDSSSGWSMANDAPATLRVTIGGKTAKPLSQLIGDTPEKYVGKIGGKAGRLAFIPAADASEMKIDHLFDR